MNLASDSKRTPPPPHQGTIVLGAHGGARLLTALFAAALLFASCEKPTDPGGNTGTKPKPITYTTTVNGTVQDASRPGVGLPGATVSASTKPAPTATTTGPNGAFTLQVTHSGSFTLTAQKACYETSPRKSVTLTSNTPYDAEVIALTPNEPTGNKRFDLTPNADGSTYTLTVADCVRTITSGEFASDHSSVPASTRANTRLAGRLGATNQHQKVTVIELPESLIRIEQQAFSAHQKVSGALTIPPTVDHIGASAFYQLSSSSNSSEQVRLDFPPSSKLKFIGSQAFRNALIQAFPQLPQSLETVEQNAFSAVTHSTVSDFVIPENVAELGNRVFGTNATFQGTLTIESPHLVRTPADTAVAKTGRLGDAMFFAPGFGTGTSPFTQIILHKTVFDSYSQADLNAIFGTGGSYVDIADRTTPLTK